MSTYDWLGSMALMPIGYLLTGPIAAIVGPQGGLLLAAVVALTATLAVASVPSVHSLRQPPL